MFTRIGLVLAGVAILSAGLAGAAGPGPHPRVPMSPEERAARVARGQAEFPALYADFSLIDWDQYREDSDSREPYAEGLIGVMTEILRQDASAVARVCRDLQNAATEQCYASLAALCAAGCGDSQVLGVLDGLVTHPSTPVRQLAVELALLVTDQAAAPVLAKTLTGEREHWIRSRAAAGLARLGDARGLVALRASLSSPDPATRRAAARCFRVVRGAAAVAELERAVKLETNDAVRADLLGSLQALTGESDRKLRQKHLGRSW